ncbi:hypothetical protein KM295_11305 [Natronomonas sp. F2-12]|jgi:hypothetical protein|uniref:Uncharacterized protein n=1 Tax=Natronomonas aquatica TaxID=2841590 RepID=A0A9R1CRW6_9EURY|nr:hypothetical protein [Natronomonas aquatica]MCQ4334054.1 hypothetical protein [Natronomonas aquatica]
MRRRSVDGAATEGILERLRARRTASNDGRTVRTNTTQAERGREDERR